MSQTREEETRSRQLRHTNLLLLLAAGMFGFAFALVPLYEVFCELTGVNGKTAGRASDTVQSLFLKEEREEKSSESIDRAVTIQFFAHCLRQRAGPAFSPTRWLCLR